MKKQILSLILALAMVLSMSVCAFATAVDPTISKNQGTAEVPLKGEVLDNKNVALISVVVPAAINFQIGTEKIGATDFTVDKIGVNSSVSAAGSGSKFVQLLSGTGTVVNNTVGNNITLELVNVVDDASYNLLDKIEMALAPANTALTDAIANYKLTAGTSSIVLASSMSNGDTLDLKIFGQAAEGTYNSTSYPVNLPDNPGATVTVTLKVSLVNSGT